ncbi:MAG TPA: alpha/beta hydrolase [Candidatus Limnocylindrales bacterium]|nr:alpha/beta hydrolase [Candidatus Limnocylindrales bacterium]
MTTTTQPTTSTLEVPGATLTYDVRPGDGSSNEPPLFLIGSPMGAGGFVTLASHFPERTVVTYDPRGVERSTATDKDTPITPHVQAEDVHAIIEALGGGPVDLFASSGAAVVTLDLVAKHPNDLRTAVAHEPPLATVVPDREQALAATKAISDTYNAKGFGHGMAKFMQVVMHQGPFTPEVIAAPAMDPAMMGMPTEDDGNRSDLMLGHSMKWLVTYEPDFEQIKRAPTRLVIAVGGDSHGELAQRGGEAVAARLGQEATRFPGDHGGFLGGEYGQTGKPDEFAAKLREVLAAA